jgi:hypothetical protein
MVKCYTNVVVGSFGGTKYLHNYTAENLKVLVSFYRSLLPADWLGINFLVIHHMSVHFTPNKIVTCKAVALAYLCLCFVVQNQLSRVC